MDPSADRAFLQLEPGEIADFARREGAAAGIPDGYLDVVTENLRVLQGHARLVVAALAEQDLDPLATAETFEP